MLIIEFDMKLKRNGRTIYESRDLCGKFESVAHFQSFRRHEEYYGRFVHNVRIIREEDKDVNSKR